MTHHNALPQGASWAHTDNRIIDGTVHGNVIQAGVVNIHSGPAHDSDRTGAGRRPEKPIRQWDPHDLEVHPAGASRPVAGRSGDPRAVVLPSYVRRAHDQNLADAAGDAAKGRSRMVVLVGSSSTGKTRACWEAVQPLADQGWALWHPFDPTRAEAALADLERVGPHTVLWLNETQHYLGGPQAGERIAAALHTLLTDPGREPVLILGTLWPEYASQYIALPHPGGPDPHSRARELLTGRTLTVPDTFDQNELLAAEALARDGDQLLADALTRAHTDGRLAQDLAGAPELLRRYQHAIPATRGLLEAAMDARRLGVGVHLPQTFLTDAAADYLTDHDWDQLTDDWAEAALSDLARPVHGKQAPLRRSAMRSPRRPPGSPTPGPEEGPMFRLADYLEQHGRATRRRLCPPASFWHAAHIHLIRPEDLNNLATAAEARFRKQWAHHLRHRAADAGHSRALFDLAVTRERAGDREGAESLYRQAADAGWPLARGSLVWMREQAGDWEGAEALYRQAADTGNPQVLANLAWMRKQAGDREGAESLYLQAADAGDPGALFDLASMREQAGDREGAEALYRQIADTGWPLALVSPVWMRERAGDWEGAEALYRQTADTGNPQVLANLAWMRERAGDREGAESLAQQAADAGDPGALTRLAQMRERAGDWESAESLYLQAADAGDPQVLAVLAEMREQAGDREGAESLAWQAADAGDPQVLAVLAEMREQAGDREGAESLYLQAADASDPGALTRLAQMRERAGDREGAESLAWQAADAGDPQVLAVLAEMREQAGDREGAESLYLQAADAGLDLHTSTIDRWPWGLDPDGSPTPPWH
ncbi:tetratricopeptide repeat protein [Streptomyces kaniharaensis]|uniref:Tetratricopeptide repeat protein n=1 Tax=Streptomyces kaniharaensis TaxID=212423 RepID=A0A6N7KZI7_9ACTN|nr:tetratricopeptide repeat protein [Streptomyces kaniharaensis]